MSEEESAAAIANLKADVHALRTALEAVMDGLAYAGQHRVLQHLQQEADDWESSFGQSPNQLPRTVTQLRVAAMRSLAQQLAVHHVRQTSAQALEAGHQEAGLQSSQSRPSARADGAG